MGLNQPQDLVWMMILFALIVFTIGLGINSVEYYQERGLYQDAELNNTFFTNIEGQAQLIKNASDEQEEALRGQTSAGVLGTIDQFIENSFQALLTLGNTYTVFKDSMTEVQGAVGLDEFYFLIITAGVLITFAVVMYTWLRTR